MTEELYDLEDDQVDDEGADILLNALAEMSEDETENAPMTEITETEAKEVLMAMIRDKPKNRTFQGAMKAKKNRDLAPRLRCWS